MTVSQAPPSPGEHLLSTIAARLLAAVPPLPHDPWLYGTAPRPRALPGIAGGLGDVTAALKECGALPPLSPVPGQLATLCARLNVTGHGITTPPARDLPEPWLSVLTQYQHRDTGAAPARDGCAAAAAVLPELDGIQLTILGLHNCQDSSILHMHASGPTCDVIYGPDELYSWPTIWIRDSDGRWHTTRTSGQQRHERRNRAPRGNSATAEPRHHLDRGARNRAISRGPRQTPAPLATTVTPGSRKPVMRRTAPPQAGQRSQADRQTLARWR